ncbi:hypothetical protein RND71_040732 [Anisodus tanguticus]|uniref:Uncharacterized protein n=1 Tax=Anisodus tanguticus TaxID=243964 RepID=A0AAE1QTI1_9SOLA|nr:hypothetical protein RND71_040732 [Anisodus tanguticus]
MSARNRLKWRFKWTICKRGSKLHDSHYVDPFVSILEEEHGKELPLEKLQDLKEPKEVDTSSSEQVYSILGKHGKESL